MSKVEVWQHAYDRHAFHACFLVHCQDIYHAPTLHIEIPMAPRDQCLFESLGPSCPRDPQGENASGWSVDSGRSGSCASHLALVAAREFPLQKKETRKLQKTEMIEAKSAWMLQIVHELLPHHLFCYSCNFSSVTLNGKASLARRVENRLILRKECLPEFQRPATARHAILRSMKEFPSNKMLLSLLSFGLCFEVLTLAKPSPTPRLLFVAQEIQSTGRHCRFSPSSSVEC